MRLSQYVIVLIIFLKKNIILFFLKKLNYILTGYPIILIKLI